MTDARLRARITRLDGSVSLPAYQTPQSAGFDLAAAEDATIAPGDVKLLRTGLVIQAPEGHFLALFIRSSAPLKKGLTLANGVGVVDRDYAGPADEVRIAVLNVTATPVIVSKGERIAQGIFLPVRQVEWDEVESLTGGSRGGFGSTG